MPCLPVNDRNRLILGAVLPLWAVVLGLKLGKLLFGFLSILGWSGAMHTLGASWLLRLVVVSGIALGAGRALGGRMRWGAPVMAWLAVAGAKLLQALIRHEWESAYHWLWDAGKEFELVVTAALGVARMDMVFLGGFTFVVYVLVRCWPSAGQRVLRRMLNLSLGVLLVISGVELALYYKTGWTGTGHLVSFFVSNNRGLWPMVRAELDFTFVIALVLPILFGFGLYWLVQRTSSPAGSATKWRLEIVLSLVGVGLVSAIYIHMPLPDHRYDHLFDNTYLRLADLVPWHNSSQVEAIKRTSHLPPIFDAAGAGLDRRPDRGPTKSNVVIILLESARADSTSLPGSSLKNTPFLQDLARRGAVVPEMYAVVPRTCAAWVAVLGGIWPSTDEEMASCALKSRLPLKGLPAMLAAQGYATAFFSSAHLSFGYDAAVIGSMGFQHVRDADMLPSAGFESPSHWGFEDRILVKPSLEWIKQQQDQQKPFMLVMMTDVGHYDYKFPAKWPKQSFGCTDGGYNDYLNCMGYVDSVVKEFVNGLEDLGVLSSSLVLVLGDHGESFGEHGPRMHSLGLYEETIKIPAVVYAEGLVAPGSTISGLRQEIDIMPSVLDVLGFDLTQGSLPGTSLLRPVAASRPAFFSCALYSQSLAMRKGALKFIYNYNRTPMEAYALDRDPLEQRDIASILPRRTMEEAEMDILVWRERVSRDYLRPLYVRRAPDLKPKPDELYVVKPRELNVP